MIRITGSPNGDTPPAHAADGEALDATSAHTSPGDGERPESAIESAEVEAIEPASGDAADGSSSTTPEEGDEPLRPLELPPPAFNPVKFGIVMATIQFVITLYFLYCR